MTCFLVTGSPDLEKHLHTSFLFVTGILSITGLVSFTALALATLVLWGLCKSACAHKYHLRFHLPRATVVVNQVMVLLRMANLYLAWRFYWYRPPFRRTPPTPGGTMYLGVRHIGENVRQIRRRALQ